MMERMALEQFKAWKDKEKGKRKPLLVTGVRQDPNQGIRFDKTSPQNFL